MSPAVALQICLVFGTASLLSIGGGNSVVPEIELQAVAYHWLTRAHPLELGFFEIGRYPNLRRNQRKHRLACLQIGSNLGHALGYPAIARRINMAV